MGDRFLSSAGAGGNCARPMRLPDPSPILDKNRAPMGPEILSSTGAGVWRKAPRAFKFIQFCTGEISVNDKVHVCEGFIRHRPPQTPPSNPHRPPLLRGQFGIDLISIRHGFVQLPWSTKLLRKEFAGE